MSANWKDAADTETVVRAGDSTAPRAILGQIDVVAIVIGLVIGAGIFKAPSIVAASSANEIMMLSAWLIGGLISIAGALCYAELASSHPHAGGEYHFLGRAYGKRLAFLFAWSRLAVLQTGSIALLAFVFGDYMSELLPLGAHGGPIYAALAVVVFTALNIAGLRTSTTIQRVASVLILLGLAGVIVTGLAFAGTTAPAAATASSSGGAAFGLAMVFVLLTYGGWNEAAYVSAELRDVRRNMARVLVISLLTITLVYVLVNAAYLNVLGLEGMRTSSVVTADAMRLAVGETGATLVTVLIILAVVTSINVSIMTGARTNYALGTDFPLFRFLGGWNDNRNAPVRAYLVQGAITLLLIALGALSSRSGFEAMVSYVSPVFWLFFLLTVLSIFVLRRREPDRPRPFRVPLYPFTPLLFCGTCAYMLYSSLAYTGFGALFGVAVLAIGVPLLFVLDREFMTRR